MIVYDMLNNFHYYSYLKLVFSEELLVIFLFYNFIKVLVFSSIVELIWPTQFFNRKNSSLYQNIRYRTFTEFLLKLRNKTNFYNFFNESFLHHFFIKSVNKKIKKIKKKKSKKKLFKKFLKN